MKTLDEICYAIYQKGGQSAVFDYTLKHKDIKWEYCEPCECESPFDKGCCLVCGSDLTRANA